MECEKRLFTDLTGARFPASGTPSAEDVLAYERRAIDRCWSRIKQARNNANPRCILWLSCSQLSHPTVTDSKLLRECDWVMNEAPQRGLLESARRMVGPNARLIQNVVGWADHDARGFLADPANRTLDFYGFAEPRDSSLPLPVEQYLAQPVESFAGRDRMAVNDRNIAAAIRFYRGSL
jgi:hypothetical protein